METIRLAQIIQSVLKKKYREDTDRYEWALVSRKNDRVLKWFGLEKPSKEQVAKEERRVQYFKHKKGGKKVFSMGYFRTSDRSGIADALKARAKEDPFVQELLNKYGFDTSIIDNLALTVVLNKATRVPYGHFSPSKKAITLLVPFFAKEHLLNSIQDEIKKYESDIRRCKKEAYEIQKAIKELEEQSSEYASPSLLKTWKRGYEFYMKEVAEKEERIKFLQEKLKDLEGKSEEELYQIGKFTQDSKERAMERIYDTFIHELRHYLDWLYGKQEQTAKEQKVPIIRRRRKPWYLRDEEISAMVTQIKKWQSVGLSKEEIKKRLLEYTSFFRNFSIDRFLEDVLAGKYDDYFKPRGL